MQKERSHFLRAALFTFRDQSQSFISINVNGKNALASKPGSQVFHNMLKSIHILISQNI